MISSQLLVMQFTPRIQEGMFIPPIRFNVIPAIGNQLQWK
jgi:hypothetical protein